MVSLVQSIFLRLMIMLKTLIRTSIFSCLLLAFPSLADDIATVTLENGAKVVLNAYSHAC